MSAFIVFGVSYVSLRPMAERVINAQIRKMQKADKEYSVTSDQWLEMVKEKQMALFNKKRKAKPISAPFGSPHPCADYIKVAERVGGFIGLQIMVRSDEVAGDKWKPYTITRR